MMDNADGAPEKKKMSGGFKGFLLWTGGIVLVLVLSSAIGSNNNGVSNSPPSTASSNTPADPIAAACQGYSSSSAQAVNYLQLEKDPTSFQGQNTTYTGQVVQIQESDGQGEIRLAVDKDAYGDWNVGDIVLVQYDGTTAAVDDDVVKVSGVLESTETYTSEAGYQITVPLMYGCTIKEASAAAPAPAAQAPAQPSTPAPTPTQTTYTTPNGAVINSSGTVVTPAPAPPASWHTAFTYSDTASASTQPFSLQGTQWRVSYTCTLSEPSMQNTGYFGGYIDSTDNSITQQFVNSISCPTQNVSYIYSQPAGQYYLNTNTDNLNYTVTIEDYY